MSFRWCVFSLAAWLPALAVAQGDASYRCTNGDLVRRLEIFYETGVAVPCEVHYFKDDEPPAQREVLWRALNESGYCESQTRAFVAQLEGWGWRCAQAQAAGATPAAASDDTDVLEAGDSD